MNTFALLPHKSSVQVLAFAAVLFAAALLAAKTSAAHPTALPDGQTTATSTAQNPAPQPGPSASAEGKSFQFDVAAAKQWVDTGIDLRAGEILHIAATGSITYPAPDPAKSQARTFGPDGLARGWRDLIHQYAVSDAGHGALIGRLGSGDAAQAFLIGADKQYQAPVAGRLFLGINQSNGDAAGAQGDFHVTVEVLNPGSSEVAAAVAGGPADASVAGITLDLLAKIPRRVSDPQGNPGDMVNVLLVGSQNELVQVFTAAGWVQVDRTVQDTVVIGLLNSLEKKDYLTMPMSTLYLFNRPQDYGFAHAEPVRVVMSRNHLRVWKSPYAIGGRPLWCVAATHDIGFERDQRNGSVTHKIDPAIDGEREYVNDTLSGTGLVIARDHVTPRNPLTQAKTATGGGFHSDGRIVLLVLKPAAPASAASQ
ncbi:MAG: LssY C-terminal domain-containing protein [Acidobacteriota bacterium]|nr:LssY C-terminal domain-containing protein [Acidobacteriota bacterium]